MNRTLGHELPSKESVGYWVWRRVLGCVALLVLSAPSWVGAQESVNPTGPVGDSTNGGSDSAATDTKIKDTARDKAKAEEHGFADQTPAEMAGSLDDTFNEALANINPSSGDLDPDKVREAFFLAAADEYKTKQEAAKATTGSKAGGDGDTWPLFGGFSLQRMQSQQSFTEPDFIQPPQRVRFVSKGENKLQGLQDELDRAKSKLKKIFPCTDFDWVADFSDKFNVEALKDYIKDLSQGVAAAAPMALLQAFSPNLAEIVKHFKVLVSFDLSANKMDCNQMQGVLSNSFGSMMRGPGYSSCIANYKGNGGVTEANKHCSDESSSFLGIDNFGKIANVVDNFAGKASNLLSNQLNVEDVQPFDVITSAFNKMRDNSDTDADYKQREQNSTLTPAEQDGDAANETKVDKHKVTASRTGFSKGAMDLLKSTLGTFTMSGSAGMQVGGGTMTQWNLSWKAESFRLVGELVEKMVQHGGLVNDFAVTHPLALSITDRNKFADYHNQLSPYFMYTWDKPWQFPGNGVADKLKNTRFSLETMDKMAHLIWVLSESYTIVSGVRQDTTAAAFLRSEFRPTATLDAIVEMELALYAYRVIWEENKVKLKKKIGEILGGENESKKDDSRKDKLDQFNAKLKEVDAKLEERWKTAAEKVVPMIARINEYILPTAIQTNPVQNSNTTSQPRALFPAPAR